MVAVDRRAGKTLPSCLVGDRLGSVNELGVLREQPPPGFERLGIGDRRVGRGDIGHGDAQAFASAGRRGLVLVLRMISHCCKIVRLLLTQ